MTPEQQRSNRRLAWILATIAIALFIGFIARGALLGF
jgi:hypothetical protein